MEQKRVSAQPTRSLSFHLPLSVTGISSFEAMLELLGTLSHELSYLSWKDQLFPVFTSFDEAQNTIILLTIMNYQPSQKVIYTKRWEIFSNFVTLSRYLKFTTSEEFFWKIMETGEPNSTQPSWWLKASNSGLMAQKA